LAKKALLWRDQAKTHGESFGENRKEEFDPQRDGSPKFSTEVLDYVGDTPALKIGYCEIMRNRHIIGSSVSDKNSHPS